MVGTISDLYQKDNPSKIKKMIKTMKNFNFKLSKSDFYPCPFTLKLSVLFRFGTDLKVLWTGFWRRSQEQKIRNWNILRLEYLLKWPTLQRVVLLLQLEFPFWWFPFSFFFQCNEQKNPFDNLSDLHSELKKRFTWNSSKVRHCQIGKIGKLGSCQVSSLVPPQQGITKVPVRSQHGIIRSSRPTKWVVFYDS